jgi:hypothetical protein
VLVQSAHRVGKPLAGIIVRTPREGVLDAGGPPLLLEGVEYQPLVRGRLPEALAEVLPEPEFPRTASHRGFSARGAGPGPSGVSSVFPALLLIEVRTASISASTERCRLAGAADWTRDGCGAPRPATVSRSMNRAQASRLEYHPSGNRQASSLTPPMPLKM